MNIKIQASIVLAAVSIVAFGGVGSAFAVDSKPNITFCHATSADKNPYVSITTDAASIIKQGHDGHEGPVYSAGSENWGDIIPSFTYTDEGNGNKATPTVVIYEGKNLPAGAAILANDCEIPLVVIVPVPPVKPEEPATPTVPVTPPVVNPPVQPPVTPPVVVPPVTPPVEAPVVTPPVVIDTPPEVIVDSPTVTVVPPVVRTLSPRPVVTTKPVALKTLPFTGGETELLALIGGALIMSGASTLALTRRK